MALKAINPTTTKAWAKLQSHFSDIKDTHLKELFQNNPKRAEELTVIWEDFYVDFSKNRVTNKTLALLIKLADELDLDDAISKYFGGDIINQTEKRAVLHTALRASKTAEVFVNGKNVIPGVFKVKDKIKKFTNMVVNGSHKGYTGKQITDIVNIGIGGSDLGPAMVRRCTSVL